MQDVIKISICFNQANSSSSVPLNFLSLLDDVALNLRLNRTVSSKNDLIRKKTVIVNLCSVSW